MLPSSREHTGVRGTGQWVRGAGQCKRRRNAVTASFPGEGYGDSPAAVTAAALAWAAASSRSLTRTEAPCWPSRRETAWPMPRPAPVTIALRPASIAARGAP